MKRRCSWMCVKFARRMAVGVIAVAMLTAGLPARAADRAASEHKAAAQDRDPFASYNKALDAAASQALKQVDVSELGTPAVTAARLAKRAKAGESGRGRNLRFARERVEQLLPVIGPILSKAGVPVQLAAVVLVESGGDPAALSPKGARGLWQLMPGTAREYGLIVNGEMDQRLDVVLSTRAAAEYLRDLYSEFHSWKLALAAYNAGDEAVHRAMTRTGGVGFVTARTALPVETQKYVPAVLHALGWFGGAGLSPSASRTRAQEVAYATGE